MFNQNPGQQFQNQSQKQLKEQMERQRRMKMGAAWSAQQREKQPAGSPAAASSGGHKVGAVFAFLILGIIFTAISMFIATGFELTDYAEVVFFVALAISLAIDFSIARRIWRGH